MAFGTNLYLENIFSNDHIWPICIVQEFKGVVCELSKMVK